MQKIRYRLETADYKNWIQWNVERNYSEKTRKKTILIFGGLVAVLMLLGIIVGRNISSMIPTLILGVFGGFYIVHSTSKEAQEKMLWKRTGLSKLEKSGNYPEVQLELLEAGLVMRAENQGMVKQYGYQEIVSVEELERLFLLETTEKTWQFVAKSAFASEEEQNMFRSFIEAKMKAAKEDPEHYSKEAMEREEQQASGESEALKSLEQTEATEEKPEKDKNAEKTEEALNEEVVQLRHVDTSNMGKIGKMAHFMAARTPETEEPDAEELNAEEPTKEKTEE